MVSECKTESLQLDKPKQSTSSVNQTSKEINMSTYKTSASLALVKDILDIIALKQDMFF